MQHMQDVMQRTLQAECVALDPLMIFLPPMPRHAITRFLAASNKQFS